MLPARPTAGTDCPTQHNARPIATRRHEPWDFQLELTCVDSGTSNIISRPHVAKNRLSDAPAVTDVPPSEDEGSLSPDDTQRHEIHDEQDIDDIDTSATEIEKVLDLDHPSKEDFVSSIAARSKEANVEVPWDATSMLPRLEILSPPPSPTTSDTDWARSLRNFQDASQERYEKETHIPVITNDNPALPSNESMFTKDQEEVRAISSQAEVQHQAEPLSEFAASLYNSNPSVPVRSYPLRIRTFQQQKPYTADKQHHARLIGRKEASVVPTRRSAYIPDDFSNLQEDSEDSDYEDDHLLKKHVETSTLPSRAESERRADSEPAPEWLMEEMDDDDLPTLEEMRRQGFTTSHEISGRHGPGSAPLPVVRLPPKLNARAKKRLEKLAHQTLDPLDSLDSEPQIIPKPQEKRPYSRRLDTGSIAKPRKVILSAGPLTDEAPTRDTSPLEIGSKHPTVTYSASSAEESPQPAAAPKKTKKHRQHVLPMAFFKRNLIPEDAATLRSMRTKRAERSSSKEAESTSETEQVQLAHHARTRISSGQGAGKLDDFMAQLALDRSEDESDAENSRSDFEHHHLVGDRYESHRRRSWVNTMVDDVERSLSHAPRRPSGRPVPQDTHPSDSYTRPSEDQYPPDDFESYSDFGYDYGQSQNRERSRSPYLKSARKRVQGERLDMIDRMIVRSSRPSAKSRSSGKDRSNKRRRISGNLQPSKYHRHHYPEQYANQDIGSFFSDDDFSTRPVDSRSSRPREYRHGRSRALSDAVSIPSDVEMSDGPSGKFQRSSSGTPPVHHSRIQRIPYLERYDTTAPPTRRRRPTIRASVVSRKTPAASLRWGSSLPSKRSRNTTRKSSTKPGTRTVQSQLNSWALPPHGSGGLPQFLNKPFFEPARRVPRPAAPTASPSKTNGYDSGTGDVDIYQSVDQPWDEQDDFVNITSRQPPVHARQDPATITTRPVHVPTVGSRPMNADLRHRLSLCPIANGLYFSRDSYIGRGMLSRVLKAVDDGCLSAHAIVDSPSSEAVFFGQSYSFGSDALALEKNFQEVMTCWALQLERSVDVQTPISGADNSNQHTHNDALQAFETMTTLLIKRLSQGSFSERCSFWKVFHEHLLLGLSKLLSEETSEGKSPMSDKVMLWGQWALVAWVILGDCAIQSESEILSDLVQSLMHTTTTRSSSHWLSRVKGMEQTAVNSQGVIYGQDLMEVWVCLIKLLNGASHRSGCGTFWETFNRGPLNQVNVTTGELNPKSDSDLLDVNGWRMLELITVLGKLHQFDRNGSSNGDLRPSANWKPIAQVLQQGWLDSSQGEDGLRISERRLREYLEFHHGLIQTWGWTPCTETAILVYRSFAAKDFRDQSTEPGYRLPEFLQRMIASTTTATMAITDSVDRHDRCFEIFLKILAKTIRSRVDVIASCEDVAVTALDESQGSGISPISNQIMSRKDLIRSCKRMLSSVSPAVVTLYPVSGITGQSYSTLCNTCNLVLLIALLVPDFIRPSSVGQLRSLLNYDDSDAASRRIMLESIYYLGVIWRQSDAQDPLHRRGRSLANIADYFYGRIDSMREELDKELKAEENAVYISRNRRQNPIETLIETAMGYVMRLLHDKDGEMVTSFPCLSFLDRRLIRFLDYETPYPSELRLQVIGVLEYFFKLRTAYSQHLGQTLEHATPSHNGFSRETTGASVVVAGDGFSSLDYDDFFDDIGDFDLSQMSEADPTNTPSTAAISVSPPLPPPPQLKPLRANTDELQLVDIIESWIYPCLSKFISSRHQAIHEDTQQHLKSTLPFNFHHSKLGAQNILPFASTESKSSPVQAKGPSLSPQGVLRLLAVFADCTIVLLDQGSKSLQTLGQVFKSESWLSLWIQHARLQDALCWANRLLEIDPEVLVANEELFLEIWFRTMGAPTSELTLQHRFMRTIMRFLNDGARSVALLSDTLLSLTLFRDLPLAYLDDTVTERKKPAISFTVDVNQSLMESSRDKKLSQEFKESRLQVLSKVLSNMGEQYLLLRSSAGTGNVQKVLAMKGRYQIFIGQLLQQVKQDYERLNIQKMVRDSKAHVELAHHVVGCVIQHCGLIVQNTPLTGSQDSILGYLTSSRFFPQPRLDGVYVHQKIRGYAFLYQAGEKQLFSELMGLALNQLKLVAGSNSFRFNLSCEYSGGSVVGASPSVISDSSVLGIRVVDCHQLIYGRAENMTDDTPSPSPGAQTSASLTLGDSLPHGNHSRPGLPGSKPTIQTLVTHQGTLVKEPLEISRDALWTLTSSLRNATLETDDRKQWSMVLSGFRSLLLAALFRPLLTAFLGDRPEEGHCSSLLRIGRNPGLNTTTSSSRWIATSGLIVVAVPAARWLKSLVEALSNDISQLTSPALQQEGVTTGRSNSAVGVTSPLLASETFQKETSVMFLPLLQSLSGCYDAVARTRLLESAREQLASLSTSERANMDFQHQISDQEKLAYQGLYLFGQLLQTVKSIAKVSRKTQLQYPEFYDRNRSWRETFLELVQVALDHSLDMMMTLGGAVDVEEHAGVADEGHEIQVDINLPLGQSDSIQWDSENRIPGVQDVASLESAFGEFLSGHSQSAAMETAVRKELLSRLGQTQGWVGDIMSEAGLDCAMTEDFDRGLQGEKGDSHHRSPVLPRASPSSRMRRQQWILWSFLSSHLDFCQTVSTLDPRFHRQVQKSLSVLLKPPPTSPLDRVSPASKESSVWFGLIHSTRDSSRQVSDPLSSWGLLGQCLGKEWNLFLTSLGNAGQQYGGGEWEKEGDVFV